MVLTKSDFDIISGNELLQDQHIDNFAVLLQKQFGYAVRTVLYIQQPQFIKKLDPSKEHIQILHSLEIGYGENPNDPKNTGHWVCCYYNAKKIYIFDSAKGKKELHEKHRIFLEKLYPEFNFNDTTMIEFPDVQLQPNHYDCGVYSIAFATSLAFGEWPIQSSFLFDQSQMRNHLMHIFRNNRITIFPKLKKKITTKSFSTALTGENSKITYQNNVFPVLGIEKKFIPKLNNEQKNLTSSKYDNLSLNIRKRIIDTKTLNNNTFFSTNTENNTMFEDKKDVKHSVSIKNNDLLTFEPRKKIKLIMLDNKQNSTTVEQSANLKTNVSSDQNNLSAPSRKRKVEPTSIIQSPIKTKRKNINNKGSLPVLNEMYLNMILNGEKLQHEHMYQFKFLLASCSIFNHRDTFYLQIPEQISPISEVHNHIQILHSTDEHWICSYYNTKKIFIYDSSNLFSLNKDQNLFLKRLYPFFDFNAKSVIFMKVQDQRHDTDSGVFAVAFAISLLFEQKPECIVYDQSLMRPHLAQIFQTNIISHFPTTYPSIMLNLAPLQEITKRNYEMQCRRTRRKRISIKSNQNELLLFNRQNNENDLKQKKILTNNIDPHIIIESRIESDFSTKLSQEIFSIRDDHSVDNTVLESDLLINKENTSNQDTKFNRDKNNNLRQKQIAAKKIVTKYRQKILKKSFYKIKSSFYYIEKLTPQINEKALVKKHLEAQRIIKWCMCQRKIYTKTLSNVLFILKKKAEFHLSHLSTNTAMTIDDYQGICGQSLHHSTTEPYYYETSYSFNALRDQIVSVNVLGQSTNVLPLLKDAHAKKKWLCNRYCRTTKEIEIYEQYKNFLERVQSKNLNILLLDNLQTFLDQLFVYHSVESAIDKLGHYHFCYESVDSCKSELTCIELLSPHFPSVRYIKQLIYKIKRTMTDLNYLDKALEFGDVEFLVNVTNKMKEKGNYLDNEQGGLCLDEDKIEAKNKSAFAAFTKRSLDLPRFKCISCQKLVFKKDVTQLSKLRKPISNEIWINLINFINEHDPTMNSDFICDYCLRKIRADGTMPPTCLLNNMYVGTIPKEIEVLNEYEKVLIQRAKAFQRVERLGTVAKKNIPHFMQLQKLKGQIFHLPLPIEETLQKICSTTDPINKNHELYIVVRSIPSKSNVIWENLINLENVFNVLTWLKSNNTLYTEIKLPQCPNNLRDWLESKNILFHVENTEEKDSEKEIISENDENHANNIKVIEEKEINSTVTEKVNKMNKTDNNDNINLEKISNESIGKITNLNEVIISQDSYCKISPENEKLTNSHDHTYSQISSSMEGKKNDDKIEDHDSNSKTVQHQAMVTQVLSPEGSQYAQYTIYPLHDKRKNDTATNMYQMLKINEKALDNRMKTLDLQCFPDLYPYGKNGQHEDRKVRISAFEYIKAKLKSADSRFRLNQQYLFYLLNDSNIRQIGQGVYHTLNVTNTREKFTAQSYLKHLQGGELEANLTTLFARLRNSEQFWSKPRNNLSCMTRHYGPGTWFFTISPAEWLWEDLIDYLKEINAPHFDKLSPNQVIAADPVSVSRFIENKFQAVLEFIQSDSHPLGKISHFFWRREYQGRGIQHFHLILWVEDAPIIGINTNEEVVEFIMKYVTCQLPDKNVSPTLYRRVTTHQQHNHNNYCLRTKKLKSGKVSKACRFGFPRPVTENFVLRDVATSIAGRRNLNSKSRLYDLPRTESEVNINDYNPSVLSVWEGNMDIQYIGEKSTVVTQYVTKYATKKEMTKTSETINEINSTKTLPQLLWKIGLRSLTHREVGSTEAADTLLGISLYGTDSETVIKWLDVRMVRNRKLKTKEEIEQLNPESTDIFCPSLIDDYYPNRPDELEDLCLYNFAKWYETTKIEPKNNINEYYQIRPGLFLKRRLRGYLINHFRYNVANQPENYFYSLLLLFQPWRNIDELKNGFETYTESFKYQQHMIEQANDYHGYNEEFEKGLEYIKALVESKCKNDDSNNEDYKNKSTDRENIEINAIVKELNDAALKHDNNCTLAGMISKMNADQTRVFEKVKSYVLSDTTKLRLYVSGEGGTGKSFLINVIKRWLKEERNQETVVTAPTGIAAFNINGLTIHRVFQLPVEHGFTPSYKQLSDSVLKALRDQLQNTTLFVIDEISMVSNITLIYMHLRLQEIFDVHDDWFGGKHVVVFGDLLQLPPVHEDPSYVTLSSEDAEKYIGSLSSIKIWANLFTYEELTINMRQKTDKSYGDLLSRLRVGSMTNNDIKVLEQRKINIKPSLSYNERLHEICNFIDKLPSDTVCLVPTCKQCDLINSVMTNKISTEEILLIAYDHLDCPKSLNKKVSDTLSKIEEDASQSAGLAKTIIIKIGAKVMLRRNIDVTLGLVNGAIGTVKSVSKSIDDREIQAINIDFGGDKEYSIERIRVKFKLLERAFVVREQFPLCLSYAVTIHKSQGLSLKTAVIEAGNSIFNVGQTYVALSRVTELTGLHLINFDPQSVKANTLAIKEYNRLRETYRPDLPTISIPEKRMHKEWDRIWAVEEHSIQIEPKKLKNSSCIDSLAIRGIENCDDVSSGLNSIIQCMFNNTIIKALLNQNQSKNNELVTLFFTYKNSGPILKSSDIKNSIIKQSRSNANIDPVVIFLQICDNNHVIKDVVQFQLDRVDRCTVCSYTESYNTLENILSLRLNDNNKLFELQNLMNLLFTKWFNDSKYCKNCKDNQEMHCRVSLNSSNQIIVVKLELHFTKKNKSMNRKKGLIKSVPKAKISLCNKMYYVASAILCSDDDGSNHYVAMIKNNSAWVKISDENVQPARWPTNSKDACILFLQKK